MSEFIDGIEIMRQSALDRIKEADDLDHAFYMIKETKFFFTPEQEEDA